MNSVFPVLETDRLGLREVSINDIPRITELAGDRAISDTVSNIPYPYTDKDATYWINMANEGFKNGTIYIFTVVLKETGEFIGSMDLHLNKAHNRAEVGYWIGKPYWNRGFCTEALKAVLAFGFSELKLNKIVAVHYRINESSGKVMQKCGMIKEGEMLQHLRKGEKYMDIMCYRITSSEYSALK